MAILDELNGFKKGERVRDKHTGRTGVIDYLTIRIKPTASVVWDDSEYDVSGKHLENLEKIET